MGRVSAEQFRRNVAGRLTNFLARPRLEGLRELKSRVSGPLPNLPAISPDRMAAEAVLTLLLVPGSDVRLERPFSDALGRETASALGRSSSELQKSALENAELREELTGLRRQLLGDDLDHPDILASFARRLSRFYDSIEREMDEPAPVAAGAPLQPTAQIRPSSRREIISSPQGEPFVLSYEMNGRRGRAAGRKQKELERKINLKGLPIIVPRLSHAGSSLRILDHEELAADLLDRFFFLQGRDFFPDRLHLRPLAKHQTRFHNEMTFRDDDPAAAQDAFTFLLKGRRIATRPDDVYQSVYRLGGQFESGVYYDTPNKDLERRGVALRVKSWHPLPRYGRSPERPSARGVFLKKDLPLESDDLFVAREESHVGVPANAGEDLILSVARALLRREGVEIDASRLRPTTVVDNFRYGVNLAWKEGDELSGIRQIGFLTIDSFTRRSADGSSAPTRATIQFEPEIFPSEEPLYRANKEKFSEFFKKLESIYQGRQERLPKYRQPG